MTKVTENAQDQKITTDAKPADVQDQKPASDTKPEADDTQADPKVITKERDDARRELGTLRRELKRLQEAEKERADAEKTELERERAAREAAEQNVVDAKQRVVAAQVETIAARAGLVAPKVVTKLIDPAAIEYDENGDASNLEKLVEATIKEYSLPTRDQSPPPGGQGVRPQSNGADDAAAALASGDWRTSIALKQQRLAGRKA